MGTECQRGIRSTLNRGQVNLESTERLRPLKATCRLKGGATIIHLFILGQLAALMSSDYHHRWILLDYALLSKGVDEKAILE